MDERSFSFPILSNSHILKAFEQLNFEMTPKMLTEPTCADTMRVFEYFIDQLMGIPLSEEQFSNSEHIFTYPELHYQSIPRMHFFRALSVLMPTVGITDFKVAEDVLKPEPTRLRKILSALINFFRFREENLPAYAECTRTTDELMQQLVPLEEENERLQAKLQALVQRNREEEETVSALEEECAQKMEENNRSTEAHTALRNQALAIKEQFGANKQEIVECKRLVDVTRQDCDTLRAQIVSNPEKLVSAMQEIRESISFKEAAAQASNSRAQQLSDKLASLRSAARGLDACCAMLEECSDIKSANDGHEKQLTALEDQLRRTRAEEAAAAEKELELQRKVANMSEKIEKLPLKARAKMEAVRQERVALEEQKRKFEHEEAPPKYAEINSAIRQAERLQEDIESCVKMHSHNVKAIHDRYLQVQKTVRAYHQSLFHAMQSVSAN